MYKLTNEMTTTEANYTVASHEFVPTPLNIPYTMFEILVAAVAVIGNAMVVIVFHKERRLRRRTNYYIVALAIADFLVGLLGIPFAILASVGLPTNLHACLFTVSLLVVCCTISIFCLVAVSVDRYWAILHPLAYSRNVRTKTAIAIISVCWVAGAIVGFLPLFGWHADVSEDQACLFVEVMDYDYLVFLYFATIITPSLLLAAFYAHIYRVIIKQVQQIVTMNPISPNGRRYSMAPINPTKKKPNKSRPHHEGTMLRVLGAARKREVKATQNLSVIVFFFMICWIPLYTINCIKAFCPDCYVHPKFTFFCIILSHLNSAVNPLLYAYHLKDFRAAMKAFIMRMFGMEVQPAQDLHYRNSVASQHRITSLMERRQSTHPRIYVDSPVWLREKANKEKQTTITCSLNTVHQTVAAIASVTADREIWKISEVPSAAERSSGNGCNENTMENFPGVLAVGNSRHCSIESSDNSITLGNDNYLIDYDDDEDDEVFVSLPYVKKYNPENRFELPFYGSSLNESISLITLPTVLNAASTAPKTILPDTVQDTTTSTHLYQTENRPPEAVGSFCNNNEKRRTSLVYFIQDESASPKLPNVIPFKFYEQFYGANCEAHMQMQCKNFFRHSECALVNNILPATCSKKRYDNTELNRGMKRAKSDTDHREHQ